MTGAAIHARAKDPVGVRPGQKVVVESATRKILGVVALVYLLPVVGFLLGYFLSEGLAEGVRYAIAIGAAALAFLPSVAYDRHAKKTEAPDLHGGAGVLMFGYVRPAADRLTQEQTDLFRSAYCGLCRTLGRRYGLPARMILNYDLAFLAILLAGGSGFSCARHRCPVHPIRGCPCGKKTRRWMRRRISASS